MVMRPCLMFLLLVALLLPLHATLGSEPDIAAETDTHYTAVDTVNIQRRRPIFTTQRG